MNFTIDIFNGFECVTDIDILNKIKHKNKTTKCKYYPFTFEFINFFLEDLNFTFVILYLPLALTARNNRFLKRLTTEKD